MQSNARSVSLRRSWKKSRHPLQIPVETIPPHLSASYVNPFGKKQIDPSLFLTGFPALHIVF